jgi:hypothetical protein
MDNNRYRCGWSGCGPRPCRWLSGGDGSQFGKIPNRRTFRAALREGGIETEPHGPRASRARLSEECRRAVGRLTCQLWDKREFTSDADSPSMPKTNDVVCGALR